MHLRPGLARGVRGPDPAAVQGHRHPARVRDAAARRHPVPAQQRQPGPRHVPRAGRHARGLPAVRDHGLPDRMVGRHGREDLAVRSAHGRADQGRHRRPHDLPGLALRDVRGPHEARARRHRAGAPGAAREARRRGQAPRGRASPDAHELRPRDDARGRVLQRHRELLASPRRPRGRKRAVHAPRLLPRRLPRRARRIARDARPAPRDVRRRPVAQVQPGRVRVPAAERDRQPSAPVRRVQRARAAARLHVGDARAVRAARLRPDRRADRPARRASWTPRSRSGRRRARSTT